MNQIKVNSQSKIISVYEDRITSLFHTTKSLEQNSFKPGKSVAYSWCVKTFEPTVTDFQTRLTSLF